MNLFGGGGTGATPERYIGMLVSGSLMGEPVPYVAGRNRIGDNLAWYGNFQSTPSKSGSKSGSSPSSFTYSAAWQAILCLGPIQGVITIWDDKSIVDLVDENLTLALGATGQAIWGGYPSGTPSNQQIPYSNEAWVGASSYQFGSSPSMPNLNFEVEGRVPGYSDANGVYDADISAIFQDYLMDPIVGALAGPFSSVISLGSPDRPFTGNTGSFQAACNAQGLLISPNEQNQRAATDFMREVLQIANADVCVSCGVIKFIPYTDQPVSATLPDGQTWTYTPDLTPVFELTYDDFCPNRGEQPITLKRKARDSLYNMVNVEYVDRTNQYNPTPTAAANAKDIAERGQRPMPSLSLHQICEASVARTVAQLVLQNNLNNINTWVFRLRGDYTAFLEPGDILAINEPALNAVGIIGWITDLEEDEKGFLQVEMLQILGTTRNTPLYNFTGSQGYVANFAEAPPSVDTPAIFQMPAIPQAASAGITLGVAVCGPTSSANWGGCSVWMSSNGGIDYELMATIGEYGPAKYGTLTGNLSAVADPDTTSTLPVALANTNLQLPTTVTTTDADNAESLMLLGSGANVEVISYGDCVLTSPGNYDLSYLRRGLYGTTPIAQTSGAQFVNLDGSIYEIAIDPGMAGRTIYFKFTSFNPMGKAEQLLTAVTAYPYAVPAGPVGGDITLVPRGSAVLSDGAIYKSTAVLAWDSDCVSASAYVAGSIQAQYCGAANTAIWAIGFMATVPGTPTVQPDGGSGNGFYGLYAHGGGSFGVNIIENGVVVYTGANPATNDVYLATNDGFSIKYTVNGALVWTTTIQLGPVRFIVPIYECGGNNSIGDLQITTGTTSTPTAFVATGTAVISDGHASKPTGSSAYDSSVYSIQGYPTCHIQGKPNLATGDKWFMSLSTTPAKTPNFTNGQFQWQMNAAAGWEIYEGATFIMSFGTPVALTDQVAISYDGTNVNYFLNNMSTPVYSHAATVAGNLFGFCPLYEATADGGINSLIFGPTPVLAVTDTSQLGTNAASQSLSSTFTSVSPGNLVSGPYTAAITGASLSSTFLGDPVGIDLSCEILVSAEHVALNSPMQLYITRDGTQIGTAYIDIYNWTQLITPAGGPVLQWQIPVSLIVTDTPSAGSHTYAATYNLAAATTAGSPIVAGCTFNNGAFKVREYKK